MQNRNSTVSASAAFRFVLTMGVVNLFADITYEGGGSINGPFLGTLGAHVVAGALRRPCPLGERPYTIRMLLDDCTHGAVFLLPGEWLFGHRFTQVGDNKRRN